MLGATDVEQPDGTRLRNRLATSTLSPLSPGDLALALHLATSFRNPYRDDFTPADELAELRCEDFLIFPHFPRSEVVSSKS